MIIDLRTNLHGCDWCHAPVMIVIESPAGVVELCWNCTLRALWKDSAWLEERLAPFQDHVLAAFQRSIPADLADTKEMRE